MINRHDSRPPLLYHPLEAANLTANSSRNPFAFFCLSVSLCRCASASLVLSNSIWTMRLSDSVFPVRVPTSGETNFRVCFVAFAPARCCFFTAALYPSLTLSFICLLAFSSSCLFCLKYCWISLSTRDISITLINPAFPLRVSSFPLNTVRSMWRVFRSCINMLQSQ